MKQLISSGFEAARKEVLVVRTVKLLIQKVQHFLQNVRQFSLSM